MKTIDLFYALTFGIASITASASLPTAGATLKYPLVYEQRQAEDYVYRPMTDFNAELSAKGLENYPGSVELSSTAQAQKVLAKYDDYTQKTVVAAIKNKDAELARYSMSAVTDKSLKTRLCYTGSPEAAVTLIANLTDVAFSDQQTELGWRYKQETHLGEGVEASDFNRHAPVLWKKWNGQGEAILFVWAESDDGTDVNTAIVPRCR